MADALRDVEAVLRERRKSALAGSYSARLLQDREAIQRKIMEEAFEVCLELARSPVNHDRLTAEAADLVFHLLVGLVGSGASFDDIVQELARRRKEG